MQEFEADKIIFIGEQNGVPERELKNALSSLFRKSIYIEEAYLARVNYGSSDNAGIALCLLGTPNELLLNEIGDIFQKMFNKDSCLDICFLSVEQHLEVEQVARPFFTAEKINSQPI